MRFWLFIALLALAGRAAVAQVSLVPRADLLATATLAQPATDTVAAIHKLFAKRRRQQTFGAVGIVVGTGAAIGLISAFAHSSGGGGGGAYGITSSGSGNDDSNITSLGVGILAIPVLAGELLYFDRYNRKREREAVSAFEAHQLPKWLRRKLKSKFFR